MKILTGITSGNGTTDNKTCEEIHPWYCDVHQEWFSCMEECERCTNAKSMTNVNTTRSARSTETARSGNQTTPLKTYKVPMCGLPDEVFSE